MTLGITVLWMLLLTAPDEGWQQTGKSDGITVSSREKKDSKVLEMRAVALIDAPPAAVWHTVRNYDHFQETMPYVETGKVLARESNDQVIYFYGVVDTPLGSKRDYIIKLVNETPDDGSGAYKVSWTASEKGPAPKDGFVRVTLNDGSWTLEPREDGRKTWVTYYVYTDPGGSIPNWIINRGNATAVAKVLKAVRETTLKASVADGGTSSR